MLRHYGTSQEGVLGKLKDFYFGKMPIHLTEEYYKNYLYILYIYTKFFTSDVAEQFSKLVVESIDILNKELPNGDHVHSEFDNASTETLTEIKKTWLYKNVLTKSNKTYVDIQNKILNLYKSLGVEFKGLHPDKGGVWFPYIKRNLNYTDNSRSEESTFFASETSGWYSDLEMGITYGKEDCTNCVIKEGQSDSDEPIYTAAYPFPVIYRSSLTICTSKGKCDDRVTINPDKFDPGVMYNYIKSNLDRLGKFKKGYDAIKLDEVDTLESFGFDYHRKRLLSSSNESGNVKYGLGSKSVTYPFYLDEYNSCLGGFVDCALSKSVGVTWKSNIEMGLRVIEYKYLR